MPDVVSLLLLRRDASVAFLQRTFQQLAQTLSPLNEDAAWVCERIGQLATGGKHLRSLLVHVGADRTAAAPADPDVAIGAAFDLLHAAFLILDDIIDSDELRRGTHTLHSAAAARAENLHGPIPRDDAAHYGICAGILAGTAALNQAYRLVINCAAPPEVTLRLLQVFQSATADSVAGEFMDVQHSLPGVRPSDELVRLASQLKTSSYSFEAPLACGALLAGRDETLPALKQLGRALGSAYQLADDIQSVFAPTAVTGKHPAGDVLLGRATPLMAFARRSPTWPELRHALAATAPGATHTPMLDTVRELLKSSGAVDQARNEAQGHLDRATAILDTPGLCSADAHQVLLSIIDYIRGVLHVA